MAQRSRATRLSRHWIHASGGPTTLNITAQGVDLLNPWRLAFGVSSTGTMTMMRLLGSISIFDNALGTGRVGFGIIKGIIGVVPTTTPLGATTIDFTEWIYWKGFGIFSVAANASDRLQEDSFDVRGMRKFDPSRETLWLMIDPAGGAVGFVDYTFNIRILCGE